MATANINVNKQSVLQLLTSGQEIPFVIPEYQRPYSWSDDEIITLFEDLWEFSIERTHSDGAKSYFLGCVVSYEENGERQIIVEGKGTQPHVHLKPVNATLGCLPIALLTTATIASHLGEISLSWNYHQKK